MLHADGTVHPLTGSPSVRAGQHEVPHPLASPPGVPLALHVPDVSLRCTQDTMDPNHGSVPRTDDGTRVVAPS